MPDQFLEPGGPIRACQGTNCWKPAQARSLRSGRQRACDPWQGDSPPVGEPNSGGGSPLSPRRPSNRRVVCRRCALGAPRAGDISFAPQVTWVGGGPILSKFGRTGTVKDRLLYNEGPIP